MQRKFQHTFTKSKMNQDLDSRLLQPDEYREGVNIAVSRAESDDVGALENILGNEIISNLQIENIFLEQVIGWKINENTNKIYLFITNYQDNSVDQISNFTAIGTVNKIVLVDTVANITSTIVSGRFLNFSWNSPVLDIIFLEDLMFWTDNRNQPRVINVKTAESNPSYYFNEDHLSLVKYYPYKTIQLNQETKINGKFYSANATGTGSIGPSIYPYFAIPSDNTVLIKSLVNNVGMTGFLQVGDESWNFKVAFVQETTITYGSVTNVTLVFIDRDLSTAQTPGSTLSNGTTAYLSFVDENSKDVSSPWFRQDAVKLTIDNTGTIVDDIEYALANTGRYKYAQALYQFGARSPYNNIGNTVRNIPNHFPNTQNAAAKIGYCRVTHPKLDPLKYYVVTSVSTGSSNNPSFKVSRLTQLINGTLIANPPEFIAILQKGDILTINQPNNFYNQNFSGDEAFLEDKFVRFSYRLKYDDGQYSLLSPFTQSVFIPKQKGNFLKTVGVQASTGAEPNHYVPQENVAGENTIVEFMENEVTQIKLRIPCEYAVNTLRDNLKISEIELLYKESTQTSIKIIDSISVDDDSIVSNSTKFFEFMYDSKEPIKTLKSGETTRVYDNAPIRAKTLSSSGNRIILGNFIDRHSSPNNLNYYVGSGRKFTPAEHAKPITSSRDFPSDLLPNRFSTVSYPKSSLKQNRSYQVGIILQDRYGRSSDVILSSITNDQFTLDTGAFFNSPINFGGSTIFHNFLNSVIEPLTAEASIKNSPVTRSGIVDWPGDSLKLLFSQLIPQEIPTLQGYPGLYEDPFVVATATSTGADYAGFPTSGLIPNLKPGMICEWTNGGVEYIAYVFGLVSNGQFVFFRNAEGGAAEEIPVVGDVCTFSYSSNPLGWYSYKIVVKQLQQDYYNVYLPSLLNGTPVIKPFDLNCTFTSGSNLVQVDPIGDIEYLTFPLLEGMKVVAGPNTYYINNILNYAQFEISGLATVSYSASPAGINIAAAMANSFTQPSQSDLTAGTQGPEVTLTGTPGSFCKVKGTVVNDTTVTPAVKKLIFEVTAAGTNYASGEVYTIGALVAAGGVSGYPAITFTLRTSNIATNKTFFSKASSPGVLNTTTLLTDNANKVPPALIETSPVQQNYSTSEVKLIPRSAKDGKWEVTAGDPYFLTNDKVASSVFPGKQEMQVQSLGNFEGIYPRASYNGLYNALNDPIVATIQNRFSVGEDSQTTLPVSQAETTAAIFETTPTETNLEIYYETSTSGNIKDLNTLIRKTISVPLTFVDSTTTTTIIGSTNAPIIINESLDYSSNPTLATVILKDQNFNTLKYYSTNAAEINVTDISISTPQYANGYPLPNGCIEFLKQSATDTSNRFIIKLNSLFPAYNAGPSSDLNIIFFNVNFKFNNIGNLFSNVSIPIRIEIENSVPVATQTVGTASGDGIYYLNNGGNGVINDPNATDANGNSKNWNNSDGTNTTRIGARNGSNANNTTNKANTNGLSLDLLAKLPGSSQFVNANNIEGLGLSLTTPQGNDAGSRVLQTTSNSQYINQNIQLSITATDGEGSGATTQISSYTINFRG